MRRKLAVVGTAQPAHRGVSSVACLAFVVFLAIAFWAGALWIGALLIHLISRGY